MLVNVDPRNDFAFKVVFGSQRHERVLVHLLNAILVPCGLRVRSVRVLNPLSEIQDLDEKKLILDVKATDETGRLYNIEMQIVAGPDFPGRFLYYWSHTYSSQLEQGDAYDLLRPVISICFVEGILFPGNDECHLRFRLLETTSHFPFTEDLDLHIFQLPQFTKSADELQSDLDLWLYELNNGSGLDLASLPRQLHVAEVEEALEALAVLTQDRIQREIYEAREKARRDAASWTRAFQRLQEQAERAQEQAEQSLSKGLLEGRAQGEFLGRIRVCEELLHRTPRPDAELAAMSVDELRQLAEELRSELSEG